MPMYEETKKAVLGVPALNPGVGIKYTSKKKSTKATKSAAYLIRSALNS